MGISLKIDENFKRIEQDITKLRKSLVPTATRQAMNKTIVSVRENLAKRLLKKRKLPKMEMKRRELIMKKARGSDLNKLGAEIAVSMNPISMRRFLKGSKTAPRPKRKGFGKFSGRALKFEIQPGKQTVIRRAFFDRGKSGNAQVFVRKGMKRLPVVKKAIAGLGTLVDSPEIKVPLRTFMRRRFAIEFKRAYEHQLLKAKTLRSKK